MVLPGSPESQKNQVKQLDTVPAFSSERAQQVGDFIVTIETPFLSSLKATFKRQGWRICGPASVALSRILAAQLHVPLGQGLQGEHIEVAMGIYDPVHTRNHQWHIEEQTYIRYFLPDGKVLYIDPIYGLLMGRQKKFDNAIQVEEYNAATIDQELMANHNIHTFRGDYPGINATKSFWKYNPAEIDIWYNDVVASFNDDRGLMKESVGNSGIIYKGECYRVIPIIKRFAPGWEENKDAIEKQEQILERTLGVKRGSRRK